MYLAIRILINLYLINYFAESFTEDVSNRSSSVVTSIQTFNTNIIDTDYFTNEEYNMTCNNTNDCTEDNVVIITVFVLISLSIIGFGLFKCNEYVKSTRRELNRNNDIPQLEENIGTVTINRIDVIDRELPPETNNIPFYIERERPELLNDQPPNYNELAPTSQIISPPPTYEDVLDNPFKFPNAH